MGNICPFSSYDEFDEFDYTFKTAAFWEQHGINRFIYDPQPYPTNHGWFAVIIGDSVAYLPPSKRCKYKGRIQKGGFLLDYVILKKKTRK